MKKQEFQSNKVRVVYTTITERKATKLPFTAYEQLSRAGITEVFLLLNEQEIEAANVKAVYSILSGPESDFDRQREAAESVGISLHIINTKQLSTDAEKLHYFNTLDPNEHDSQYATILLNPNTSEKSDLFPNNTESIWVTGNDFWLSDSQWIMNAAMMVLNKIVDDLRYVNFSKEQALKFYKMLESSAEIVKRYLKAVEIRVKADEDREEADSAYRKAGNQVEWIESRIKPSIKLRKEKAYHRLWEANSAAESIVKEMVSSIQLFQQFRSLFDIQSIQSRRAQAELSETATQEMLVKSVKPTAELTAQKKAESRQIISFSQQKICVLLAGFRQDIDTKKPIAAYCTNREFNQLAQAGIRDVYLVLDTQEYADGIKGIPGSELSESALSNYKKAAYEAGIHLTVIKSDELNTNEKKLNYFQNSPHCKTHAYYGTLFIDQNQNINSQTKTETSQMRLFKNIQKHGENPSLMSIPESYKSNLDNIVVESNGAELSNASWLYTAIETMTKILYTICAQQTSSEENHMKLNDIKTTFNASKHLYSELCSSLRILQESLQENLRNTNLIWQQGYDEKKIEAYQQQRDELVKKTQETEQKIFHVLHDLVQQTKDLHLLELSTIVHQSDSQPNESPETKLPKAT